jgi:hypothetical protein
MSEYVYPRAPDKKFMPNILSDEEIAYEIIAKREVGFTRIRAELDALSICHDQAAVKRVSKEIDEEVKALNALDPLAYATGQEFLEAITQTCKYLTAALWVSKLKERYEVNTFAELKEVLTPKGM